MWGAIYIYICGGGGGGGGGGGQRLCVCFVTEMEANNVEVLHTTCQSVLSSRKDTS